MNFEKLEIWNFLTVGQAAVDLTDRGLLLIQGVNEDDPSAESNGAGKSSIVDALCWSLYGVTARGVTGDAVVNKTAKKNCCVAVVLVDGNFEYRVVRHRKHDTGKNVVTVSQRNIITGIGADISKGTDKETQEVINKAIGCSLDVFMASVYCGQENMVDLPGMTDKVLKTLIEEAAGIEVLTDAYTVARSRYNAVKGSFDTATETHRLTVAQLATLATDLADMTINSVEFDTGRKDRAKAELVKILPIKAQIKELQEKINEHDEPAIAAKLVELQGQLAAQTTQQSELDALNVARQRLEQGVARLETQLEAANRHILNTERAIATVDAQVGKDCKECGKTYHAADLCDVKGIREDDAARAVKEAVPLTAALEAEKEAVKRAAEKASAFKASMTDVSAVAARQRVLSALKTSIDGQRLAIKTFEYEMVRHSDAAKVKLNEANPWDMGIAGKKREIEAQEANLVTRRKRLDALTAEVELLADAVAVFGPAGVRAHVLDTVTPYLNDRTQDYLGALADGNIHAVWSTLSKTAKGDLKEKFNIEVTNDKGAESFAGLSGGEKRKVRLATAMALQDMVASRASKPISIFIADEVDHALDEAGLERLMGVLERKAKERGTVLVISHNALGAWISEVITVTKSGGYATVSGENLRS